MSRIAQIEVGKGKSSAEDLGQMAIQIIPSPAHSSIIEVQSQSDN
jgi:hypothetical protein